MNWIVFLVVAWFGFGLEIALPAYFDAGSGGVHPSLILPLMVYVTLYAPRRHALWAACILGVITDLISPIPRLDLGDAFIVGPHAIGMMVACQFVLSVRAMVIRHNPLTLMILSVLSVVITQIIVVAFFTARSIGDDPLVWDAGAQLIQRLFSALYTAIPALVLSFVFFALTPVFGFHSAVPTRFARHF